jgi:hypothetical protein
VQGKHRTKGKGVVAKRPLMHVGGLLRKSGRKLRIGRSEGV